MTLTTARSTTVTPFRVPVSPGRAKVAAAAAALQQAIDEMFAEDKAKARARERVRQENAAKTERRVRLAQTRLAARAQWVEAPAKWFWSFANESLDSMRDLAAEAKRQGQRREAAALESRIDVICGELERIQQRQIGGAK
jgi:hypothetical protein